jgi:hypothetical protein
MDFFSNAIQELRAVSITDYEDRVEDICRDLDGELLEVGCWPTTFFSEVLKLLSDPKFLTVRTSWHLLYFIRSNWEYLSPTDVSALRNVLADAYEKFGDWMGPFLVSEVLGKFYPDENTLAIFKRLSEAVRPPALELVPHGLETLAKTTHDETIRSEAVREL